MKHGIRSDGFAVWLRKLPDGVAVAKITTRIDRLCRGNPGEVKRVGGGGGVNQMRIDHGPGYRVYFAENRDQIIIILADGTTSAQAADIVKAKRLVKTLKTKMKTAPYKTSEFLRTPDAMLAYMDEALDTKDAAFIAHALAFVVRAKKISRDSVK
jgi:putative addiction module killer protein